MFVKCSKKNRILRRSRTAVIGPLILKSSLLRMCQCILAIYRLTRNRIYLPGFSAGRRSFPVQLCRRHHQVSIITKEDVCVRQWIGVCSYQTLTHQKFERSLNSVCTTTVIIMGRVMSNMIKFGLQGRALCRDSWHPRCVYRALSF